MSEIIRVNRTHNYTVMSNTHLRDKSLSLKACGLLSKILSLPDNWSYSVAGLSAICKEGKASVASAINELIIAGYIIRSRERAKNGQLSNVIYNIFEEPQTNQKKREIVPVDGFAADSIFDYFSAEEWDNQVEEKDSADHEMLRDETKQKDATEVKKESTVIKNANNVITESVRSKVTNKKEEVKAKKKPDNDLPRLGFPDMENQRMAQSQENQGVEEGQIKKKPNNDLPRLGFPDLDFQPQLNTKELNTSISKTIHTTPTGGVNNTKGKQECKVSQSQETDIETQYRYVRDRLCDNMNYPTLCKDYRKERVDAVLEVMLDVFFQTSDTVTISKDERRPIGIVRKVFLSLREEHIRAVLEALTHPRSKIYNHRKFILALLYRSVSLAVLDDYVVDPILQETRDKSKNRFHNFRSGDYDIAELERKLIKN